MMDEKTGKEKARKHYDQGAEEYIEQYQEGYKEYPANFIRLNLIIEQLKKSKCKTVLDAGCGTCGPMIRLLREGFEVAGFDFSQEMVEQGKKELAKAGYSPELVYYADLENAASLQKKKFDAIIALGVFPHILDDTKALTHMRHILNPGGTVYIECRNALFATYTLNKYSLDFFLNKVIDIATLPTDVSDAVVAFYSERLKVDKPIKTVEGKVLYTDILAKFHNPLTIGGELFAPCDFSITNIHFYHYHALPPIFESTYPKLFRELSLKLERPNDWRGYVMASAFVVEAKSNS